MKRLYITDNVQRLRIIAIVETRHGTSLQTQNQQIMQWILVQPGKKKSPRMRGFFNIKTNKTIKGLVGLAVEDLIQTNTSNLCYGIGVTEL